MYSKWNQRDRKMVSVVYRLQGRGSGGRIRERWEGFKREMRKILGVMDIFIILIVVMVSWVHTYTKANQIIYFKYAVYCISIIPQQGCLICSCSCSLTQRDIPQPPKLDTQTPWTRIIWKLLTFKISLNTNDLLHLGHQSADLHVSRENMILLIIVILILFINLSWKVQHYSKVNGCNKV